MKSFFARYTLLLLLLAVQTIVFAQSATVRGFVYDKETGEPIIFTNVFLKGTTIGASTDVNGFYSINKIPPGSYTLTSTYLGYDTAKTSITLKDAQIITQKLYLSKSSVNLKVFEVSAEKQEQKTEVKMSVIKITPKEIKQLPTVGGEADIAQYLQVLPGVIFTGDQGGQLYIRGGSPIQNKVLLDGMIIYNPFHSIGLFSVFDTDIIRNADIYTGGFNAQYGGRVSSVMDITTRDGNKKRFAGKIGATTFGAKAMVEGPLIRQKEDGGSSASFIFSGKTSYLEQSSKVVYSYINPDGLPFNFTDLYGKVSFNGSNGSKFNVFGFNFNDQVKYQAVSDLNWNSYGGGTNFILIPGSSPVLVEGRFSYSQYDIALKEGELPERSSKINGFNGGLDFTYFMGENELKYGAEILGFSTDFTFFNEVGRQIQQKENTTEFAGYLKYKLNRGKLVLEPSFRLHYYATLSTASPEPRLGGKYNISDRIRIKFATGIYSQNLISASSDKDVVNLFYGFLSGPSDLQDQVDFQPMPWSDPTTRDVSHALQKANHYILGSEFDLTNRFTLNVEGYLKQFTQLTNINRNKLYDDNSANSAKADVYKKDFIVETGHAYGLDFVLKYDYKRMYFWAVYSISKVTRYDGVYTNKEGEIDTYYPVFDRRHNVNLVGSYTFGKNLDWEFNARWNFGSGFPFTQTLGYYENYTFGGDINYDYTTGNGDLGIRYAELNAGRLPTYHRLDLNMKKTFAISTNSILEANLGVTNAYNRENIFYFDRVKYERVNQLPLMPSVGLNLTF